MKLTKIALVAAIALTAQAQAAFINGSISFFGNYVPSPDAANLATATGLDFSPPIGTLNGFGDYAAVPDLTIASFTDLTFSPFVGPAALWTFTDAGLTYSFSLASLSIDDQSADSLTLSGSGLASITGFDDTTGTWTITANKNGQSLSFSSGANVTPDGGTSIALLGVSLLGLAGVRRKLAKK